MPCVASLICLKVFELFARHKVKVDLISTSETNISITVHESVDDRRVERLLEDLEALGHCSIKKHRAIISIIGEGMAKKVCSPRITVDGHHVMNVCFRSHAIVCACLLQIGLAAEMMGCLAEQSVNFEMITQGASEINTTVVIKQEDAGL